MSGYKVGNYSIAQGYAAIIGVVLVVVGLLGFINNPIVGEPAGNPLFVTGAVHNIVHILTGAIALYIAFGLSGETQIQAIAGFGILYAVIFLALLLSPNLFGILGAAPTYNVNTFDHVLHAGLAVISGAVWYLARSGSTSTAPAR